MRSGAYVAGADTVSWRRGGARRQLLADSISSSPWLRLRSNRRDGRRPGQAHALGAAQGRCIRWPGDRWWRMCWTLRERSRRARSCLVVGHGARAVRGRRSPTPDLAIVTQDPPRGTGDAVRVALAGLPDDGVTLVVNGDCPLIPAGDVRDARRMSRPAGRLVGADRPRQSIRRDSGAWFAMRRGCGARDRRGQGCDARLSARSTEIYTGVLAAPTPLLRRSSRRSQGRQRAARVLSDRRRRARGARRRRRSRRTSPPTKRTCSASTTARSWRPIERIVQARAAER